MPEEPRVEIQLHPETMVEGKRLGSHFHKDSRSLDHPVAELIQGYQTDPTKLTSKQWHRHVAPFDQGNVGSCTGNACAGMLATDPLWEHKGPDGHVMYYSESRLCLPLYEEATRIDGLGDPYPPNDRGSSTLGVLKAAKALGHISSYKWAFGLVDALNTLALQSAIITGVLWYEGFDAPTPDGELIIGGNVRGGHELVLDRIDVSRRRVYGHNSWGKSWDDHGKFWWSWDTFEVLLHDQGEVGVGIR